MKSGSQNEFSRIIKIEDSILGNSFEFNAEKKELEDLAKRFDLFEIKNVNINCKINPHSIPGTFILNIILKSEVIEFVDKEKENGLRINETFDIIISDQETANYNADLLKDIDIEIIDKKNNIDIGEIASQYISLCIFM